MFCYFSSFSKLMQLCDRIMFLSLNTLTKMNKVKGYSKKKSDIVLSILIRRD